MYNKITNLINMPAQKVTKAPVKSSQKKVTKKSVKKEVVSPMMKETQPAPTPVASPVVSETPVENEVVQLPFGEVMQAMNVFQSNLQGVINSLNQIKGEFKSLEKRVQKEARVTQKAMAKRRKKNTTRAPSGFVKPTRISDELANFLGKEIGCEMARTSVTKEINTYIKANNLKDPQNGRIIHPDAKLSALLKVTAKDEVTYFNLQKYMSHHFHKASQPLA